MKEGYKQNKVIFFSIFSKTEKRLYLEEIL